MFLKIFKINTISLSTLLYIVIRENSVEWNKHSYLNSEVVVFKRLSIAFSRALGQSVLRLEHLEIKVY